MARKPDLPCADCGTLMWRGPTSLPQGAARCLPCRRAAPTRIKPTVRRGAPCPSCGEPKTSNGARPCRKCDRIGSRQPRTCEACGVTYKPTHSLQRACGRACGVWFHAGTTLSCPIEIRTCLVCLSPYSHKRERAHGTCSTTCRQQARITLFPPKPSPDPEWRTRTYECPMCGDDFTNVYTTRVVHCSTKCSRRANKLRRRVREAQSYGEWRWSDFMRVASRFEYCCAYCGTKPERLDPDHVVPLSKGGPNIIGNLLPTCLHCNSDKQAYSLAEWAERRTARGLPPRRTTWSPEDHRYRHLTVLGEVTTRAA